MNLTSKKVTVQKSAKELCDFLCEVKNFEKLMPENISKFELIRENAFIFALKGMLAIFTYGFEIAEDNFKNAAVSLHTLSDYKNLLQLAEKSNYITASEAEVLAAWRMNPDTWGQ